MRRVGRPRIYDEPRVATAVRLPASLRLELQAVAARRDVSVNLLVTRAVAHYLRCLAEAESAAPDGADPALVPAAAVGR